MTILLASFFLVFFRGIQQLNVVHHRYVAAALTPYLIACADVSSVLLVVHKGWSSIPWVGTGGAIGVTAAMYTHRKFVRKT